MSRYFERHLAHAVETALLDTPAVFIAGPRQAGKTTMCLRIAERRGALCRLSTPAWPEPT